MLKQFLPRSLFGRSLLILVTPLLLVQAVATFIFYDRVWQTVSRRLAAGVAGDVGMGVELLADGTQAADISSILQMASTKMGLRMSFRPGEFLPKPQSEPPEGILERELTASLIERVGSPFVLDAWSLPRDVEILVELPYGVLRVLAPRERLFTSTIYIFFLWMAGTSLVVFVIAVLFMRNQIRPIRRLAEAADAFGKGREGPDFKPAGSTEVRQAAAAFILMRERVRRFLTQRTEMLAGVSHDLRTPLTRMKLELAMLGDGPEVIGLKTDVSEMERMVDSYLAFARGEGGEKPITTDLGALLAELAQAARRAGHAVGLDTEGDLMVSIRPEAFKRCLDNLIANATRHGTRVTVAAARRGRQIEILVDDDGPGIPAERREQVFKAFVRLDPSRNPSTGGVGLGLTIARDIVLGHGGELTLIDSPDGGLRARIKLPV